MNLLKKTRLALTYAAQLEAEDNGFIVTFRDLPNVFTEGDTYDEAIANAQTVLEFLLTDMSEDKLSIPKPTPYKEGEICFNVSL